MDNFELYSAAELQAIVDFTRAHPKQAKEREIRDLDVCPRIPRLPNPNNLHQESKFQEIKDHLYFTRATLEHHHEKARNGPAHLTEDGLATPWLLISMPISHAKAKEKSIWGNDNDYQNFACFSTFFTTKLGRDQTVRVGLFCTEREYLDGQDIDNMYYHSWVAILMPLGERKPKQRQGNRLVIYDCNATAEFRDQERDYTELPLEMQRKFLAYAQTKAKIDELWIAGETFGPPDGKCMALTATWLVKTLLEWRQWPYTEAQMGRKRWASIGLD